MGKRWKYFMKQENIRLLTHARQFKQREVATSKKRVQPRNDTEEAIESEEKTEVLHKKKSSRLETDEGEC